MLSHVNLAVYSSSWVLDNLILPLISIASQVVHFNLTEHLLLTDIDNLLYLVIMILKYVPPNSSLLYHYSDLSSELFKV